VTERLPAWFRQDLPDQALLQGVDERMAGSRLHTICQSALCPNAGQCFERRTATFLILGDTCTRRCTFCAVKKGVPSAIDTEEGQHILDVARSLGLSYVVITSVTRDDLTDGGASHFAGVAGTLRRGGIKTEVLVPDFQGDRVALSAVLAGQPVVLNHNIETVPRLYGEVRPQADYRRSLGLISRAKETEPHTITKSGLMLGLGEDESEVIEVLHDLRAAGCDLLTIGQYLQPTPRHRPVDRYVTPDEFSIYALRAEEMGFAAIASAPLVRSSYHAREMYETVLSSAELKAVSTRR
jgi:lipoic acid synthetase